MVKVLADSWWAFVVRGVVAIVFALIAFAAPFATISAMVLWFGAYALVDGVFSVTAAVLNRRDDWVLLLLQGLLGIIVGYLTFRSPTMTAIVLLFYIAAWMLVMGATKIALAVRLRKEIQGEWFLALSGAVSLLAAFVLLWQPVVGALAMVTVIAAYALVLGILLIVFGVRMRRFRTLPADG
jgi:uncharacterized membrane protein HdeD (DUF308 family)